MTTTLKHSMKELEMIWRAINSIGSVYVNQCKGDDYGADALDRLRLKLRQQYHYAWLREKYNLRRGPHKADGHYLADGNHWSYRIHQNKLSRKWIVKIGVAENWIKEPELEGDTLHGALTNIWRNEGQIDRDRLKAEHRRKSQQDATS